MDRTTTRLGVVLLLVVPLLFAAGCGTLVRERPSARGARPSGGRQASTSAYTRTFVINKNLMRNTGRTPYFTLERGYTITLRGNENGQPSSLLVRVLDYSPEIDGVKTRAIEERHGTRNKLDRLTFSYVAIDRRTANVYVFGQDTRRYRGDKVVESNSWRSGENGSRFGLLVPGQPLAGARFLESLQSGDARRSTVLSTNRFVETPLADYSNAVEVDTTGGASDSFTSFYGFRVGLVKRGGLEAVKAGGPSAAASGELESADAR